MPTQKDRILDWLPMAVPWKLLAPLSLPVGWQLETRWHHRFESARMIETAFGFVRNNEVEGDYPELAVYEGRTFSEAWRVARRHGLDAMRFHAFDPFAGLPEPERGDRGGGFYGGRFHCARERFEAVLRRQRVDVSRVGIHEGFFDETLSDARSLPRRGIEKAAVLWIDCDPYASSVPVLSALISVVGDGTVLVFDEWHCFRARPDRGEQLACREWLRANPQIRLVEYHRFHWAGASFIVNLDETPPALAASAPRCPS